MANSSTNGLGALLYTKSKTSNFKGGYFNDRNRAIGEFNRVMFKKNDDGKYVAKYSGCRLSEPIEYLDYDELIEACNNLPEAKVNAIKAKNKELYKAHLQRIKDELYPILDEALGYDFSDLEG